MNDDLMRLGARVRGLRRREGLTQSQLAEQLGISASYLNLIEHDRRPLTAPLLIKLAQQFKLDLLELASDEQNQLAADLLEVFGDPMFEGHDLTNTDVREVTTGAPAVARAVRTLYEAYRTARQSAETVAARVADSDELAEVAPVGMPSEEVNDFIQKQMNHFPDLEAGAEALWRDARLEPDDLYRGLTRYMFDVLGVVVQVERVDSMGSAVRQYDPVRRRLSLSEVLPPRSRNFQIAHQIGLLTQGETLDRLVRNPILTTEESRVITRITLANYFAAAVLMPYQPFLEAAKAERYDIEMLGHRFRASFEQVCHRLTTLRRPGAEGVPFHLIRIDIAGNISKRFSASGIRFARFSGVCPRWNVCAAFHTPGMIRVQLSEMPDGKLYFCMARTIRTGRGGYLSPHSLQAIGMGCEVRYARELVYSDGVDLEHPQAVVSIGVTCRLCPRMDCEQRAFPPLQHPLRVNENVRGISFYAPVETAERPITGAVRQVAARGT